MMVKDHLDPNVLKGRVKTLSRQLRQAQMRRHQTIHHDVPPFPQADIYFEPGPGGDYPIVTLRSLPCSYFLRGNCAPCAYSARPRPAQNKNLDPYSGLLRQVDDLLARFDDLFSRKADGQLPGHRLRHRKHDRIYTLQLAGESSFFSDHEIPPAYRREILERFRNFGQQQGVDWHLMLETRPEDLTKAAQSGELNRLQPLLESLNVVVNMGFEHENDFLRQVIFAKDLDKADFLRALTVAQSHGLDPGVFLFAGGFILTPQEALQEVANGLAFLEPLGVFVNLMIPNLQAFTLPDLLYCAEHYDLPEPQWLLEVMNLLLNYAPHRPDAVTPVHWFMGGIVAEPMPVASIINHPRRKCSMPYAKKLLKIARNLMLCGDLEALKQKHKNHMKYFSNFKIVGDSMPCYGKLPVDLTCREDFRQKQMSALAWPQRTHHALTIAEQQIETYLNTKLSKA